MSEDFVEAGGQRFALQRYPERGTTSLRAIDHAERAVLRAVDETSGPLLLLGEGHGALGLGTWGRERVWVIDQASSRAALAANVRRNGRDPDPLLTFCGPLAIPAAAPSGEAFAAVALAWPRGQAEGLAMLDRASAAVPAGTPIHIGARSDAISKRGFRALGERLDDLQTPRAEGRLRRISGRSKTTTAPAGTTYAGPHGLSMRTHVGVFSHGRVDVGSARLIEALGDNPHGAAGLRGPLQDVLDLGCGDGVLGLCVAATAPLASLTLLDDSALAVDAALASAEASRGAIGDVAVRGVHADGCDSLLDASIDLVVCNPPFHDGAALSRATAARMFRDAARVLRPGGVLVVVANRHLGYDARLRRHFPQVAVAHVDPQFVVLRARR